MDKNQKLVNAYKAKDYKRKEHKQKVVYALYISDRHGYYDRKTFNSEKDALKAKARIHKQGDFTIRVRKLKSTEARETSGMRL